MFGGTKDIHEVLLLIQAVSGKIYETRPTQTHLAASACQMATYGGCGEQDCGSDVIRCSFRRSHLIANRFKRHMAQEYAEFFYV